LEIVFFPLFILGIVVLVIVFRDEIFAIFRSPERLRDWVDEWGAWGPLVFIGLQIFQVVIFVVPGEVPQIAGGYLFGVWQGLLYSLVGITIGSGINFFIAKGLGMRSVNAVFGEEQVAKFHSLLETQRARIGFFVFFLIPGIPKDVLCYLGGLSSLRFGWFLLVSMSGRLPGVLGSAVIGDSAASEQWTLAIGVFAAAVALFALGLAFRERIRRLVERLVLGSKDDKDQGGGEEPD
jgi:uncharacterized membrane protein YdjX (TVP38/TMEM64 family)